jgi:hypothetical protein
MIENETCPLTLERPRGGDEEVGRVASVHDAELPLFCQAAKKPPDAPESDRVLAEISNYAPVSDPKRKAVDLDALIELVGIAVSRALR